jgi:type II pantothenate kinase
MRHLKDNALALNGSKPNDLCIMATGGGAFKYHDRIKKALGADVLREDEMACLIIGQFPILRPSIPSYLAHIHVNAIA